MTTLVAGEPVGEYVVESELGEGRFGTVYRATNARGAVVAVKVLAPYPQIERFVADARAASAIKHPNIADIFAFGQLADGRHYYVMELLDGQPLDQFITQSGGAALGAAIPILRGLARALDAAHAKGIAHRALEPKSVFLARDREGNVRPKLFDFGVAHLAEATPFYMSPEQARGRGAIDHRTDIYSFGCVTYELLTGKVPFDGGDVLFQQTSMEPIPPSARAKLNPRLPPLPDSVDEAISSMMKKHPEARVSDLASAITAIENAATAADIDFSLGASHRALTPAPRTSAKLAQPLPAQVVTPVFPTAPPARSNLWIVIVFVVLAAAAGAAYVMMYRT